MPATDPSGLIFANVTDLGQQFLGRATIGQTVIQLVGFSVGRSGYDPADFLNALPIDTTQTALGDQVYPAATGYAAFSALQSPSIGTVVCDCRLPADQQPSNADYGLGELGIWALVLQSNIPAEVGTAFLFAISHFPVKVKTNRDVFVLRTVTQM